MVPGSTLSKMRIKELRAERETLWERFESHPHEIELAAELRIIDDLIADCNETRDHRDHETVKSSHQHRAASAVVGAG
jgi:hypothetical protein